MALSDYTGRTVDLFIMQGAQESGMQAITPGLGADFGGAVTTGVQKAAQFFMILFLTELTTRTHEPTFGTRFITKTRHSNVNSSQVQLAFHEAAEDVMEQQSRYKETGAADDEVIGNLELLNFSIPNTAELDLTVRITTLAGSSRVVVLPVTTAIR